MEHNDGISQKIIFSLNSAIDAVEVMHTDLVDCESSIEENWQGTSADNFLDQFNELLTALTSQKDAMISLRDAISEATTNAINAEETVQEEI